jgi:ubiquitin-conjugating enzyme E2 R
MAAVPHLQKQLKELLAHPLGGFRIEVKDDIFQWIVWFAGPQGTPYHPGIYKALLSFPQDFPMKPPEFKIVSSVWHPNVYPDGKVCISILHPPGVDDMNSGETAMMRWTPIQSIQSVLLSVISLFSDPDSQDAGAPANVDALVQFRKDRPTFNARCQQLAHKSLADLPPNFVPPPTEDSKPEASQERGYSFVADDEGYDDDGETGEDAHPYAAELDQVRKMHVGSDKPDEHILALLTRYKGDIGTVIDALC